MKYLIAVIIVLGLYSEGFSQTIINAERHIEGADSTIYALTFSYNGTRGNAKTDIINLSPAIIFLREQNEIRLFGGYNRLSQSDAVILNSGFIHLRHNYKFSENLRTFEFYQRQFNNVLLLDKRELFGAGLKYDFLNKKIINSNVSLGIMREVEVLDRTKLMVDEVYETKYFRATFTNNTRLEFGSKAKIENVFYYQPYIGDLADFRMLNDLNFTVSVTPYFSMLALLSTRFDSQPPSLLKKFDNILSFGFSVKF